MICKLNFKFVVIMVICLFFVNSGSPQAFSETEDSVDNRQIDLSKVTYLLSETKKDPELEKAFAQVFQLKRGEDRVQYYYNRVDLNNDGEPETFVYLTGPLVCGTGGCSAAIFQFDGDQYKLVSKFSLVRNPIIIRDQTTNKWKDIIMYVSGGGMEGAYRELRYDGKEYPSNPSVQPIVQDGKIKGLGIISDDLSQNKGITF